MLLTHFLIKFLVVKGKNIKLVQRISYTVDAYLSRWIKYADNIFIPSHRGLPGVIVKHGGYVFLGHGLPGEHLGQAGLSHHSVPYHSTTNGLLHVA